MHVCDRERESSFNSTAKTYIEAELGEVLLIIWQEHVKSIMLFKSLEKWVDLRFGFQWYNIGAGCKENKRVTDTVWQ